MKRLLDSLLSRWYVPRRVYDGAQNFFINETRRLTNALVAERSKCPDCGVYEDMYHLSDCAQLRKGTIIITTDYRQAPCS